MELQIKANCDPLLRFQKPEDTVSTFIDNLQITYLTKTYLYEVFWPKKLNIIFKTIENIRNGLISLAAVPRRPANGDRLLALLSVFSTCKQSPFIAASPSHVSSNEPVRKDVELKNKNDES